MTAPTQALPPWLSDSTSLGTNAAGETTTTFTTVVNLPLTYFGPSIPLGSDSVWVYGGSSSPVPSSFNPPTILPTSLGSVISSSTLATPTSESVLQSTTSSSQSSALTTSPPATSPTTTSPTTTSPSPPLVSSTILSSSAIQGESSHTNYAGVIVGSVLGSVLGSLLLFFALIWFLRKRLGGQRRPARRPEPPMSQVMWMWHDVHRGDEDQDADLDAQLRSPDDASPQTSGDERDAFLRRSRDASHGARAATPTARLVDLPRSSPDSASPVGVALASASKPRDPSPGRRHIIPRKQLAKATFPEEAEPGPDAPLLPPPTANLDTSHGSRRSLLPSERSMTPGNDPEAALLYTAQRVQVGKSPQSSTWAEGIGMPNILRRSWLNPKRSGTPTTPSQKSSFVGRQLTDNELEAGRNLRSDLGYRDAVRPISGVSMMSSGSARSGNTVFYDAQSREDLTPTPPHVPPLPQGAAPTSRVVHTGPSPLSAEPLRAASESEEHSVYQPTLDNDAVDYLDVPIPRPASPFASVSSTNRLSPPPGLGIPDSIPTTVPSFDISDAILEDAPPGAGESWRQIAQGLPSLQERRTTFGLAPTTIVYPREQTVSEQGSLHSMRSRIGMHSALSISGSAPASNSNSAHSRGITAGSLKSLAHSSSVSSIDRRLARRSPGEVSPPLSATGRHGHRRSHSSVLPQSQSQSQPHVGIGESTVYPQPLVQHMTSTSITTTGTTGSSVTTHTSVTDPITGEMGRLSHPAWTGGREFDFLPEESEPSGDDARMQPSLWGGSWSSPGHLRVLQNRVGGRESPNSRA